MKKGLLLLPLVGGMMLAGCDLSNLFNIFKNDNNQQQNQGNNNQGNNNQGNNNQGNNDQGNTTGGDDHGTGGGNTTGGDDHGTGGGSTVTEGSVVLDFSQSNFKDDKVTPYIEDATTLQTFIYNGTTYNDKGCFATAYDNNYYLMMKNKWTDHKVVEGEEFAFIGNATSYGKAIKSVEVTTASNSGSVDFIVAFGTTAFTSSTATGTKHTVTATSSGAPVINFTETAGTGCEYWSISATRPVGQYAKNGAVAKIVINFVD